MSRPPHAVHGPDKAPGCPPGASSVAEPAQLRLSLTAPEHAALEAVARAEGLKPSDLAARVVSRWLRSTPAGLALDLAPELLLGVATARLATDDELRARLRVAADQGDDRIINACRAALAGDTEARRVLGVVLEREAEATAAG